MPDVRRRCILAAISLTIAWVLFHGYVAAILWARGDEFLRNGNPAAAERYYRRALAIDPACRDALDRLLFAAIELKRQPDLDAAIAASDRYLRLDPLGIGIRTNRALALLAAHRYGIAAEEFRWLARRLHDRRFMRLALRAEAGASEGGRT
jgi:tetratricopeptide (TPR) repeat protein